MKQFLFLLANCVSLFVSMSLFSQNTGTEVDCQQTWEKAKALVKASKYIESKQEFINLLSTSKQLDRGCFDLLDSLRIELNKNGQIDISKSLYMESSEIVLKSNFKNKPLLLSLLYFNLSSLFWDTEMYSESLNYLKSTVDYNLIVETQKLDTSIAFKRRQIESYCSLADLYFHYGYPQLSIELFQKSLDCFAEYKKKSKPSDYDKTEAQICLRLGRNYRKERKRQIELEYYVRAENIAKDYAVSYPGIKSMDLLLEINKHLGVYYYDEGNYIKSCKYHRESLKYGLILLTVDSSDFWHTTKTATSQAYLGDALRQSEDIEGALLNYLDAYVLLSKSNKNKNNIAILCRKIGIAYELKNQKEDALRYYLKGLEILESQSANNRDSSSIALSIESIADIYLKLKLFKNAKSYYHKVLDSRKLAATKEKSKDTDYHLSVAYGRIALTYMNIGICDSAVICKNKELDLLNQAKSDEKDAFIESEYMGALLGAGDIYLNCQNYPKARECYNRVLVMSAKPDSTNFEFAKGRIRGLAHEKMAELEAKDGKFTLGLQYNNKALEEYRKLSRYELNIGCQTDLARCLGQGSILALMSKNITLSKTLAGEQYTQIINIYNRVNNGFMEQSLTDVLGYLNDNMLLSANLAMADSTLAGDAYNRALCNKGFRLFQLKKIKESVYAKKDSTTIYTLNEMNRIRKKLADSAQIGVQYNFKLQVDEILKYYQLEKSLAHLLDEADSRNWFNITWKDIQATLSEGEVCLEFVVSNYQDGNNWTDSLQYSVLMLSNKGAPKLIKLSTKNEVDKLFNQHLIKGKINNDLYHYPELLYAALWKNIESHTPNTTRNIYFAPEGPLFQINHSAIYSRNSDTSSILGNKYNMRQLVSTRKLLNRNKVDNKKTNSSRSAVIVGGIDFDACEDCSPTNKSGKKWKDLSFSKLEVDTIASMLSRHGFEVQSFSGKKACERKLKSINKFSPTIFHVATHSTDKGSLKVHPEFNNGFELLNKQMSLKRRGIVLSGANAKEQCASEDAFLDAEEIEYDLSFIDGADIVVFSCCGTALGITQNGELPVGLACAAKNAGANYVIASICDVDDSYAQLFMADFYHFYLKGLSVPEAFRYAQKNRQKESLHTSKWGMYVLFE